MRSYRKIALVGIVFAVAIFVVGCDESEADKRQREETNKMMEEAHKQVGMPDIVNWTERKLARDILELRDQEDLTTWTYYHDMHGKLHLLGKSIGYGLPYSVQFTNPERVDYYSSGRITLPQPDPSGLFMPDGLSATWVLLVDPKSGKPRPVYVEPQITVSPFPLDHVK